MKILSIFIDMLRANRLQLFQPSLMRKNKLDKCLENIGGTVFTNFITQGPDTVRALSAYFSGEAPWDNGCDTRIKLPAAFLNSNLTTIIDLFENNNFEQLFFSDPNEREFLFPKQFSSHKFNKNFNLRNFLDDNKLSSNCHLFISLSDFHWAIDDLGANVIGEKIGYEKVVNSLSILFKQFEPNTFDYILIFSDHGFKFSSEYKKQNKKNRLYLHNEDRVRPVFFIRKKYQDILNFEDKLITHSDIKKIYKNMLENNSKGLNIPSRKYICFEDHDDFSYSKFMNTEVFGLVNKKHFYIRGFNDCLLLDRNGRFISNEINNKYDSILFEQTSLREKLSYFEKIPDMHKLICKPDFFSDGTRRIIKTRVIKDNIKKFLNINF